MRKPLAQALELDLHGGLTEAVTPYAGSVLLLDLALLSGVIVVAEQALPSKRSPKGPAPGQFVESFVLLSALGGDCLDDFDGLRRDNVSPCARGVRATGADHHRDAGDRRELITEIKQPTRVRAAAALPLERVGAPRNQLTLPGCSSTQSRIEALVMTGER